MRILCVDDDDFIRKAIYEKGLGQILQTKDDIQVAASGEEAIEKIDAQNFDLVITDLKMPGLSGLDVLKHVKQNITTTEVMVVTGVASVQSAVEAIKLGARDYIEKPVSLDILVEKINNIRDFHDLQSETEEFRLAKEIYENEAGDQLHSLEIANQEMVQAIAKVHEVINDSSTDKPSSTIEKIATILRSLKK